MNELKIGQVVRLNSDDIPMTVVGLGLDRDVPIAGVAYFNTDDALEYDELPIAALTGLPEDD